MRSDFEEKFARELIAYIKSIDYSLGMIAKSLNDKQDHCCDCNKCKNKEDKKDV